MGCDLWSIDSVMPVDQAKFDMPGYKQQTSRTLSGKFKLFDMI